eukprot:Nk52_evm81s208 gene=Nk52_evmTU81s208
MSDAAQGEEEKEKKKTKKKKKEEGGAAGPSGLLSSTSTIKGGGGRAMASVAGVAAPSAGRADGQCVPGIAGIALPGHPGIVGADIHALTTHTPQGNPTAAALLHLNHHPYLPGGGGGALSTINPSMPVHSTGAALGGGDDDLNGHYEMGSNGSSNHNGENVRNLSLRGFMKSGPMRGGFPGNDDDDDETRAAVDEDEHELCLRMSLQMCGGGVGGMNSRCSVFDCISSGAGDVVTVGTSGDGVPHGTLHRSSTGGGNGLDVSISLPAVYFEDEKGDSEDEEGRVDDSFQGIGRKPKGYLQHPPHNVRMATAAAFAVNGPLFTSQRSRLVSESSETCISNISASDERRRPSNELLDVRGYHPRPVRPRRRNSASSASASASSSRQCSRSNSLNVPPPGANEMDRRGFMPRLFNQQISFAHSSTSTGRRNSGGHVNDEALEDDEEFLSFQERFSRSSWKETGKASSSRESRLSSPPPFPLPRPSKVGDGYRNDLCWLTPSFSSPSSGGRVDEHPGSVQQVGGVAHPGGYSRDVTPVSGTGGGQLGPEPIVRKKKEKYRYTGAIESTHRLEEEFAFDKADEDTCVRRRVKDKRPARRVNRVVDEENERGPSEDEMMFVGNRRKMQMDEAMGTLRHYNQADALTDRKNCESNMDTDGRERIAVSRRVSRSISMRREQQRQQQRSRFENGAIPQSLEANRYLSATGSSGNGGVLNPEFVWGELALYPFQLHSLS